MPDSSFHSTAPFSQENYLEMAEENARLRTELKLAQELIQSAPAFFGFVSTTGMVLNLNDRAAQIIETPREDIIGKVFWDLPWWKPLPDSARRIREAVLNASQGSTSRFDIEYAAIVEGDVNCRWVEIEVLPVHEREKSISRIIVTGVDITERKNSEQKAARALNELYAFFMQAPQPMVILMGTEYRFQIANPPYEKLIGRKLVGKTVEEVFTHEEVGRFIPLLDRVYQTGVPFIGREELLALPDGNGKVHRHWLNFGYHPFRDADGKIQGIIAIIQEVTDLVLARMKAEENERHLRRYIEAMPQMAFMADPTGAITFFNQRWYDYIGIEGETEGWAWKDQPIHHPDDLERAIATWKNSVGAETSYEIEYRLRRYDGQYRWHLGRAVPLKDENGQVQVWVGTNTDIHDQKILVEKLQEERELRERFVSTLTHDLRTPLTAAKIGVQLLIKKPNNPDEVQRGALRIAFNMDRTDRMIRDLLDASQIKSGEKLYLEMESFQMNQLISEMLSELSTIHGERFVLIADEVINGTWSPNAVRRILENLCLNAIKYGYQNSPVTVTLQKEDQSVFIEVHNEGNPISVEDQATLFEPFRRGKDAEARKQKGWGLGLTLVKGLSEAQGGQVRVQSDPEKGTRFEVRLPLNAESKLLN